MAEVDLRSLSSEVNAVQALLSAYAVAGWQPVLPAAYFPSQDEWVKARAVSLWLIKPEQSLFGSSMTGPMCTSSLANQRGSDGPPANAHTPQTAWKGIIDVDLLRRVEAGKAHDNRHDAYVRVAPAD